MVGGALRIWSASRRAVVDEVVDVVVDVVVDRVPPPQTQQWIVGDAEACRVNQPQAKSHPGPVPCVLVQ